MPIWLTKCIPLVSSDHRHCAGISSVDDIKKWRMENSDALSSGQGDALSIVPPLFVFRWQFWDGI